MTSSFTRTFSNNRIPPVPSTSGWPHNSTPASSSVRSAWYGVERTALIAASATTAFLTRNAVSVTVVVVTLIVVIGVLVYLFRHYPPLVAWLQRVRHSGTVSSVVLPRSDNAYIHAYESPTEAEENTSNTSSFGAYATKTNTLPIHTKRPLARPDPNAVSPGDKEVFNVNNNITYQPTPPHMHRNSLPPNRSSKLFRMVPTGAIMAGPKTNSHCTPPNKRLSTTFKVHHDCIHN